MKRDAVQKNAHIPVIGYQISMFFIGNQIYGGKIYFEIKISEFGYAELEIRTKS